MAAAKRATYVALVNRSEEIRRQWLSAPSESCKVWQYQGKEFKVLPEVLVESWDELFKAAKTTDVEIDARELVLAIDDFQRPVADYIKQWMTDRAADVTTVSPSGSDAMWQAWDKVLLAAKPIKKQIPAPPRILLLQGVSEQQVAKMYGWYNQYGDPDLAYLHEMMENWEENFDPDEWIPPTWKRRAKDMDVLWGPRCAAMKSIMEIEAKDAARREGRTTPPPPPVEELAKLPGMRIEQIARMHHKTVDEIREFMLENEISLEPEDYANPHMKAVKRASQKKATDTKIKNFEDYDHHPELADNLEDQAMACLDDGLSVKEVAELLTYHRGMYYTSRQISEIKKRWSAGKIAPEKPVSDKKPEKAKV